MSDIVIVSPHCDDECIGTYEILRKEKNIVIVYSANVATERRQNSLKLKEYFDIKLQTFNLSIPPPILQKTNKFYFPDPIYENHPEHRKWGMIGEQMAREGFDVIFYTTQMNAPYIHEVKDSIDKERLLNLVYPDQKSLWEYEKKYVLFEGRCSWLF